ncbi:MAG TPA: hypothetical protein VNT26_24155 [Candidatus Sulfotelmatobacter sp.]|nr:hypothetical protein [Candidatus Sulfotelmatobacter sp.]
MKGLFVLAAVFLAGVATAQQTNGTAPPNGASFQAQAAQRAKETPPGLPALKPNEFLSGKLLYSGIVVEAVQTGRPLQLINPLAPARYGPAEDNVVRDPVSRRVSGLRLFAIRF